jgi:hypothetical protein
LPADLHFLDEAGLLRRISATGEGPEALTDAGLAIRTYALSLDGRIAAASETGLMLIDESGARGIAEGPTRSLVWSRDGLRLAYTAADGLRIHDLRSGRETRTGIPAEALAWSPDGLRVVGLDEAASLAIINLSGNTASQQSLPIAGVEAAAWLPGRDAVWLAGRGLRILSLSPALALTDLMPPGVRSPIAYARADDQLLALIDEGAAWKAVAFDLRSPRIAAEELGPARIQHDAALVWAPGGRLAAIAGPSGVDLFDPLGGGRVPLWRQPARDANWSLPRP